MKKVLFGLLAMSAVAMSAQVNLGNAAATGTNIFEGGQEGVINIVGTLTSTLPPVKYVIFASSDSGTTMDDTLQLTDFVVATNGSTAQSGFKGTNPKVYVKKIVGGAATNLDVGTVVQYKFSGGSKPDLGFSNLLSNNGREFSVVPTALLSTTQLNSVITRSQVTTGLTADGGYIKDASSNVFVPKDAIFYKMDTDGSMTFTSKVATFTGQRLSESDSQKLVNSFANGESFSDAKVKVKIN